MVKSNPTMDRMVELMFESATEEQSMPYRAGAAIRKAGGAVSRFFDREKQAKLRMTGMRPPQGGKLPPTEPGTGATTTPPKTPPKKGATTTPPKKKVRIADPATFKPEKKGWSGQGKPRPFKR